MGRRGPPPKPPDLKLLAGNPGKRPIVVDELPELPPADAACPDYLKGNARWEWERLAPTLVEKGVLTIADVQQFAAYCEAFGTWRQYEGLCEESGPEKAVMLGYRNAADRASDRMAKLGSRFGLDAVSRANVKATPPKKDTPAATDNRTRFFGVNGGKKA